ncbi:diacylglycerol kinase [Actinocrispum sp. NPDC049592]|uniref:NAD(P)H-dependent amine dehydrogenase family protein n=1 Tax=Actinocrispum sp. NPDC049592 TaxID=3154835 RepID=UPI00343F9B31
MTYKVVQWSTGNVGRHAIAGVAAHPALTLAGVWTSTPDKVGRDAGELAGIAPLGVQATSSVGDLLALKPDCVVYTAMADDRLAEATADLTMLLRAGVNVVSSCPVFLQFPAGVVPPEVTQPITEAAAEGNASLFVNGIDPGFANDTLPLVLTGISERIDAVRCLEILDYSTYDNRKVLFDIMGFGLPFDQTPLLLQPGILPLAWGSVVHQLAAGLGITLDSVEATHERIPAPDTFEIKSGTIQKGTAAALRFEVAGMYHGRKVCVLEHITRLHPDLAPDWPQPTGQGCYRVVVTGEPTMTLDLQLMGSDGDHNTAGLKTTAMRLVNAIPHVIQAPPGLLTALDLPLITGKGLVA